MNKTLKMIISFVMSFAKSQIDEVAIYIINKYATKTQKNDICKKISCGCIKPVTKTKKNKGA